MSQASEHAAGRPAILCVVRPLPSDTAPPAPDVADILSRAGWTVLCAATRQSAESALLRTPAIGIVVCDTVVDGTKAADFFTGIRALLPPHRDLLAIFLAQTASINDVVAALHAGATDFIGRTVAAEYLLEAVRGAEQKWRARGTARADMAKLGALVEQTRRQIDTMSGRAAADGRAPAHNGGAAALSAAPHDMALDPDGVHAANLHQRRLRQVAATLKASVARHRIFGETLGADPAWWMLLDLYERTLQNRTVSVSSLCLASGAATSTALRRLDELLAADLVRRERDSNDARRTFIHLTEEARQRLASYFDSISQ